MAGTSRALTLKLLADIDNFTKGINQADNDVSTFGDKITKFGKIAGAAFLAAGAAAVAYAGKLAIDGFHPDFKSLGRFSTSFSFHCAMRYKQDVPHTPELRDDLFSCHLPSSVIRWTNYESVR